MAGTTTTLSTSAHEALSATAIILPAIERVFAITTASQHAARPTLTSARYVSVRSTLSMSTVTGGHVSLMRYDIGKNE